MPILNCSYLKMFILCVYFIVFVLAFWELQVNDGTGAAGTRGQAWSGTGSERWCSHHPSHTCLLIA